MQLVSGLALATRIGITRAKVAEGDIVRLLSISSVLSCHVMADIFGLIEPEIAPFDPPTLKTLPRTKHEVDRMTYGGIAI